MPTKNVIFVDDDTTSKYLASRTSDRLDCNFLFFERATDVFDSIEIIKPKLVVLDLAMTDMDGIYDEKAGVQVCGAIRERYGEQFPILILTGMESAELIGECLHAGADDYYLKGHVFTGLVKRIAAWLVVDYQAGDPKKEREIAASVLDKLVATRGLLTVKEWRRVAMLEICRKEQETQQDRFPRRPLDDLFARRPVTVPKQA